METSGPRPDDAGEQKPSRPLERYIQILEMVAAFPEEMTLAQLAHALGLPKTTVYRLLNGLTGSRLVTSSAKRTGGFRLAPRLLQLLHLGSDGQEVEFLAQPHLQELAEEMNLTSYLAKLSGGRVRSIAMGAPNTAWCVYVTPGSEMFPHATASAKAIMAFQPEEAIGQALQEPLTRFTPNTRTDVAAVRAEYEEVRESGVARCLAEDVEGFGALACPIHLPEIGVLYSVGLTGPIDIVFRRPIHRATDRLKQAALRLATAIETGDRIGRTRRQAAEAAPPD